MAQTGGKAEKGEGEVRTVTGACVMRFKQHNVCGGEGPVLCVM